MDLSVYFLACAVDFDLFLAILSKKIILPSHVGHYCPEGSTAAVPCPSGMYQDQPGQTICKPCVEGYYCDGTTQPVVHYRDTPCPAGKQMPNFAK